MIFKRDKNKSVFDRINDYLIKRGHELLLSVYLSNYNGCNIYIRFDYVGPMSLYKIVWVDLDFFNLKHIEDYINVQMVTKNFSVKILEMLRSVDYDNCYSYNEDIIGDRVEILSYIKEQPKEYIFDRFLPLDWELLIDPLAMLFTYLPRSMEVFFNEIVAKFDETEDKYNYIKPVRFDLFKGDSLRFFAPIVLSEGTTLYDHSGVQFLEKVDKDKYMAIVKDKGKKHLVLLEQVDKEHVCMRCNCKANTFCKHIYAALLALRGKKFNNFYKVKYIGKEDSLLEKVMGGFHYCFGIEKDKILLVSAEGRIFYADFIVKGKCVFDVIEDDDACTLSTLLKNKVNDK